MALSAAALVIAFLGLFRRYDMSIEAQTSGDILGSVITTQNAGMAVLTPAEAVRHLRWEDEDVKKDRKKRVDEYRTFPEPQEEVARFDASGEPAKDEPQTRSGTA